MFSNAFWCTYWSSSQSLSSDRFLSRTKYFRLRFLFSSLDLWMCLHKYIKSVTKFCGRRFKKFIWHTMVKQGIISLLIFSFLVSSSLLILTEAQTDSGNNLSCLDSEISCDYNKCLTKILKCDGNADCMDGTDEKNCSSGKILRN